MEPTQTNLFDLHIDSASTLYLKDAARWARFLGIIGFIMCGMAVCFAILAVTVMAGLFNTLGTGSLFGGINVTSAGVGLIYTILALIFFFPCLYLYNFGMRMKTALLRNDQEQLVVSFKNARACLRFIGILMIIAIGFWILMLIFIVIAGIVATNKVA
jgi:hypothetical protein